MFTRDIAVYFRHSMNLGIVGKELRGSPAETEFNALVVRAPVPPVGSADVEPRRSASAPQLQRLAVQGGRRGHQDRIRLQQLHPRRRHRVQRPLADEPTVKDLRTPS